MVGEFSDSAQLRAFGLAGEGIFATPTVIARETQDQYEVSLVGHIESIRESYYAISVERKLSHPGVTAIVEGAKH